MIRKILTTTVAAGTLATGGLGLTATSASAYVAPATDHIEYYNGTEGSPSHAKGAKGGIFLAEAICVDENGDYQPPTVISVTITGTGSDIHKRWNGEEGSGYDAWLVRVMPGHYDTEMTSTCADGYSDTATDSVKVGQLTSSQTVSKSEYRKVKKGMSKKTVANKVGKLHNDGWGWYSRPSTTFYRSVSFHFNKHGKLAEKHWD